MVAIWLKFLQLKIETIIKLLYIQYILLQPSDKLSWQKQYYYQSNAYICFLTPGKYLKMDIEFIYLEESKLRTICK